LKKDTKGSLVV